MSYLNKVQLIARLGRDPELKTTNNGTSVANFSVATTETYKDKSGEKKQQTEWHNLVIWGKLADVASKYLKKGDLAYFEGKLQTRSWEKDGVTRYTTEVVVSSLAMLGSPSSNGHAPEPEPVGATDDLPF